MKRAILYLILLGLSALLGGCLDVGGIRLSIDLRQMRGEVVYLNIVSDAGSEAAIKGDLKGLIEMAYGDEGNHEMATTTVSRELYAEDGQLNGRTTFIINNADKFLAEFEILRNIGGGYFMEVRDGDVTYADGNGVLVDAGAGPRVVWDRHAEVIEAELRYDLSKKEVAGLLPYWEEWRRWDSEDGPDALKMLSEQLGEALGPDPAENSIDYCPNSVCVEFSSGLRTEGSFRRLADFAYIYLYYVSDDPTLEGFKAFGEERVSDMVFKNMRDCADADELENARCALRMLASTYSIKLTSITYGEEDSEETPIDLEEKLRGM